MRTKLAVLLASALGFGLAQSASAADIPTKAPARAPAAVVPATTWTGCYIGAQGGYAWGDTGYHTGIPATPGSGYTFDVSGGVVGGHVGCNYQVNWFVFGVEGDGEWTGLSGDDGGRGGTIDRIEGNWQASLRGRAGIAVGQALIYATGGAAWLNVDYSRPDFNTEVINKTLGGWTVGAGLEYGFTPNWSARIEYRYAEFDSEGFPFTTGSQRTLRDTSVNTIRAGISYRFGSWR